MNGKYMMLRFERLSKGLVVQSIFGLVYSLFLMHL
jgi:hypothetical protein